VVVALQLNPGMVQIDDIWEVIGGVSKGGIIVRSGRETSSLQIAERLCPGALVEVMEQHAGRLHYRMLSGTGPKSGWVSTKVKGKDLLVKAEHRASHATHRGEAELATTDVPETESKWVETHALESFHDCPLLPSKAEVGKDGLWHYSQRFGLEFSDLTIPSFGLRLVSDFHKPLSVPGYSVPADIYPFLGMQLGNPKRGGGCRSDANSAQRRRLGYAGSLDKMPPFVFFETDDDVCLRAGGFRHGQVIRDRSGGELIVIGCRVVHGQPRLWFQPTALGRPGAGMFEEASVEMLQEKFSPVAPPVGQDTRQLLHQVVFQDFDVFEDGDCESLVLCRHCCLPVSKTEASSDPIHAECLAKIVLSSAHEEAEARCSEETELKKARRAEFEIGWIASEMVPHCTQIDTILNAQSVPGVMFCLVLGEGASGVRVVPTLEPAASINLEYLALALQVRSTEGREPLFSLDPVDPTDKGSMQQKRFSPSWLAGTSVGDVLFQADYHLKELSMGEHVQPIVGLRSCLDLLEAAPQFNDWNAREWYVVKNAVVAMSEDGVLIPLLQMGVEAREQVLCAGGEALEDACVTRPDHPLVRYAQAFTEAFDLIAERRSVVFHLRELAKASVLAKFLLDADVPLDDCWFQHKSKARAACCMEIPQLWNERYHSQLKLRDGYVADAGQASCTTVNGVYGGVEFGLDKFDLATPMSSQLPPAIAPAFPSLAPRLPLPQKVTAPIVHPAAEATLVSATSEPGAKAAIPRFSKRVKGIGAARGVDLCLDRFDLSGSVERVANAGFQASESSTLALGQVFWADLDHAGSQSVFQEDDKTLLRDIFNPHLSDRRADGDLFMPPDTSGRYIDGLRVLVGAEKKWRQQRKDHFFSNKFIVSNAGPLFPSSWTKSVGEGAVPATARPLWARPDCKAAAQAFEHALKSVTPEFDKSTEDGTAYRIYRLGSIEVRTSQEYGGQEVIGAVFSLVPGASDTHQVQDTDRIIRVTEYVEQTRAHGCCAPRVDWESTLRAVELSGGSPFHSFIVLRTEADGIIVTERLPCGTVAWRENPRDFEDRCSFARMVRNAKVGGDAGGCGVTLGEVRKRGVADKDLSVAATRDALGKHYAQDLFCFVAGETLNTGFRHPSKTASVTLSAEGEGGWHTAKPQRYSKQSFRVRCGQQQQQQHQQQTE